MPPTRSRKAPMQSCSPGRPPRANIRCRPCRRSERSLKTRSESPPSASCRRLDPIGSRHGRALCEAAVTLSTTGHAEAIVAVTRQGKTARLLSALRPGAVIYAATESEQLARTLTLLHGVVPIITSERDPERLARVMIDRRILAAGSVVVFISVSPELTGLDSNFLKVQKIG